VGGQTLAGIFRLMSGETHMLCYHVMVDEKPTDDPAQNATPNKLMRGQDTARKIRRKNGW
jgi:hypothetical protein